MRNTMQLGESINTYDPGVALEGEIGTFQVSTPGGEKLYITCKPGDALASIQWGEGESKKPFLVTKISEPVARQHTPLRAVAAG
jgi:hypothetical protein